jgi:hypothetical protein
VYLPLPPPEETTDETDAFRLYLLTISKHSDADLEDLVENYREGKGDYSGDHLGIVCALSQLGLLARSLGDDDVERRVMHAIYHDSVVELL